MAKRDAAIEDPRRVLLAEHDRLVQLVMVLVDEIEHSQTEGSDKIDPAALRNAAGRMLLDSMSRHDSALLELGIKVRPALTLTKENP